MIYVQDSFRTDEVYQFPNNSIVFRILKNELKLPPGLLPGMQQLLLLEPVQYPFQ